MNYKRWITTTCIVAGLCGLVAPFQNCAPADVGLDSESIVDEEIRVADDWSRKKVSFLESSIKVNDENTEVQLMGICARQVDGESLFWQVVDNNNEVALEAGESSCEEGGFEFLVKNVNDLECGRTYKVMVSATEGEDAIATLVRNCKVLAQVDQQN